MTPRRASKRTSTVTKSKELEETLQKRREKSEIRVQTARSKALQKLVNEEERVFTEEAFRLFDIAERLLHDPSLETADSRSQERTESYGKE